MMFLTSLKHLLFPALATPGVRPNTDLAAADFSALMDVQFDAPRAEYSSAVTDASSALANTSGADVVPISTSVLASVDSSFMSSSQPPAVDRQIVSSTRIEPNDALPARFREVAAGAAPAAWTNAAPVAEAERLPEDAPNESRPDRAVLSGPGPADAALREPADLSNRRDDALELLPAPVFNGVAPASGNAASITPNGIRGAEPRAVPKPDSELVSEKGEVSPAAEADAPMRAEVDADSLAAALAPIAVSPSVTQDMASNNNPIDNKSAAVPHDTPVATAPETAPDLSAQSPVISSTRSPVVPASASAITAKPPTPLTTIASTSPHAQIEPASPNMRVSRAAAVSFATSPIAAPSDGQRPALQADALTPAPTVPTAEVIPAQDGPSEPSGFARVSQPAEPTPPLLVTAVPIAGRTAEAPAQSATMSPTAALPPTDLPLMASQPDPATASEAAAMPKPAPHTFEALSLLQWARDHVPERPAPHSGAKAEPVIPVADVATPASTHAPVSPPAAFAPVLPPASSTQSVTMPVPVAPAADVAASIGATIVDMGVGGQWIDRLARDIAGLAANGPQGSFRIETGALGPVEVAINRTGEGTVIALHVASDAAEAALRQDSDRLRQDAALSAVRIADLRIERAPLADAPRGDAMSRDGGQQQGASDHRGSAMGQQGAGQSAGRHAHENSPVVAKAGGDRAVLDDGQAHDRASDAPRARFA